MTKSEYDRYKDAPYPWSLEEGAVLKYPPDQIVYVAPLEEKYDDVMKDGPQNLGDIDDSKLWLSKGDLESVRDVAVQMHGERQRKYISDAHPSLNVMNEQMIYSPTYFQTEVEWEEKKKKYDNLKNKYDNFIKAGHDNYENDQKDKEIRNLKEIMTQQKQIINDFRYKKSQEEKKLKEDLIHFMELSDKYLKDVSSIKNKLQLLETNPEEYHRRKISDPHDEEIWD